MTAAGATLPLSAAGAAASPGVAVRPAAGFAGLYDYAVPDGMALAPGDIVRVPLGPRDLWGVVWGAALGEVPPDRLKPVAERSWAPPFAPALRGFLDWVADYTLSPPGAVLRLALPVPEALAPERLVPRLARAAAWPEGLRPTPGRTGVWAAIGERGPLSRTEAARIAGVGDAVVDGMVAGGALVRSALPAVPAVSFAEPDPAFAPPVLDAAQAEAAAGLRAAAEGGFSVTLLDGVTGSGKTEVYFEAVARVLERGRQALVLVPEIALTGQWLARFVARFGTAPAVWHSGLPPPVRRDTWRAVAAGRVRVLIGARSALFLPFPDLGLIVVDEEHEPAYKQEDGVVYQARDMAVVRGRAEGVAVVLASATPSLETLANVRSGRYGSLRLPERHGEAVLPAVTTVDLRKEAPARGPWGRSFLSPPLVRAMDETLDRGEQVLLFLNRRGYAPLTLCRACGHRMVCPHCTAWLVEHRVGDSATLVCHHCGFAMPLPDSCPECGAETEVWSRVVGYLRPVQNFNKGKKEEYSQRKKYVIGE